MYLLTDSDSLAVFREFNCGSNVSLVTPRFSYYFCHFLFLLQKICYGENGRIHVHFCLLELEAVLLGSNKTSEREQVVALYKIKYNANNMYNKKSKTPILTLTPFLKIWGEERLNMLKNQAKIRNCHLESRQIFTSLEWFHLPKSV